MEIGIAGTGSVARALGTGLVLAGLDYDGVLIDPTNRYSTGGETTQLAHVAGLAPDARVVEAFNTVGAEVLADPDLDGIPATMLVADDDREAKETVVGLARDLGSGPFDAGDARSTVATALLVHITHLPAE
jgi:predicted dinucleotide-binding enzyme